MLLATFRFLALFALCPLFEDAYYKDLATSYAATTFRVGLQPCWMVDVSITPSSARTSDTLFILRKRRLITLHWYHHITVMIFCWNSWATFCLNGIVYSSMNCARRNVLLLHARSWLQTTAYAQFITILQILQMLVGTAVTAYVNFHMRFVETKPFTLSMKVPPELSTAAHSHAKTCHVSSSNAFFGMLMYASYLWLFCVFYYRAYILPRRKRKQA